MEVTEINFSDEELLLIAVLLDDDEAKPTGRRKWVHPSLLCRATDETKFFQYFRMSREQFEILLSKIGSDLKKQNTTFRAAISPREKLAVCLRFLATGDSFRTIAFSFRLGYCMVQNAVHGVCKAIVKNMLQEVMPTPTKNEWERIAREFWDQWQFPNCLGSLDGKHVVIEAPQNSGSLYFNYKKTFSIVLLALVDANYKFIAVDIGSYGRSSDGGIFSTSKLGRRLEMGTLDIPEDALLPGTQQLAPYVIVGDPAFPLKKYLMRPFPGLQVENRIERRIFNYRLSRTRRVVENAFGILTQKFRIYNRRLKLAPKYAEKVVLATCILHNFIRAGTAATPLNDDQIMAGNLTDLSRQGGNCSTVAFEIREIFTRFFNSEQGFVPWQHNMI
ncbi:uncharacterized protein LOC111875283 [Cryptotermes secundus]|uniref:uncharacterized protein LOC111875283 n=1 Tax=Cryptotermes secundus TaxID=105785 RepID=UPI000CD7DDD4|nr:uncharacterized protein LOC111875283 [Cryptotermes secundus]